MTNRRTVKILILLSVLFLSLILYLTYFEVAQSETVAQNPFNQRQWLYEEDIQRGEIVDTNGVVLAKTEDNLRIYPYNNLYSHIIGYNSRIYGKSMLESKYNKQLLGDDGLSQTFNITPNKVGYDLALTIDHDVQTQAYNSLGNRNGAVVALDPKTGEVLAMVSKPDFNPNADWLAQNWDTLTIDENAPLLARATSGLYPPGSTFKIVTASAAIEQGLEDQTFEDKGSIKIGKKVYENQGGKVYGNIDMTRGFVVSSNVVFCRLGIQIGSTALAQTAERFGFNKTFDFDVPTSKSSFPVKEMNQEQVAALGIGQGEILATPLQMAMVASAIANDGIIMKPFLVKNILNQNGFVVNDTKPQVLYKAVSSDIAYEIKEDMKEVVKSGTGTGVALRGVEVAAKTGTAENERTEKNADKEHTWMVAFAPADDPQIAVAVMMEYSGGSGGANCAPIAREVIRSYLNKQ